MSMSSSSFVDGKSCGKSNLSPFFFPFSFSPTFRPSLHYIVHTESILCIGVHIHLFLVSWEKVVENHFSKNHSKSTLRKTITFDFPKNVTETPPAASYHDSMASRIKNRWKVRKWAGKSQEAYFLTFSLKVLFRNLQAYHPTECSAPTYMRLTSGVVLAKHTRHFVDLAGWGSFRVHPN